MFIIATVSTTDKPRAAGRPRRAGARRSPLRVRVRPGRSQPRSRHNRGRSRPNRFGPPRPDLAHRAGRPGLSESLDPGWGGPWTTKALDATHPPRPQRAGIVKPVKLVKSFKALRLVKPITPVKLVKLVKLVKPFEPVKLFGLVKPFEPVKPVKTGAGPGPLSPAGGSSGPAAGPGFGALI